MICQWQTGGKLVFQAKGRMGNYACLAYSPDGKWLTWEKQGRTICLANPRTGKEIRILQGFKSEVRHLTFSPNSKTLASIHDSGAVRLWDVQTSKLLRQLQGKVYMMRFVRFSPDGKLLAAAMFFRVRRWDVTTGKEYQPHRGDLGPIIFMGLSPDGKKLVTATLKEDLWVWDVPTGNLLQRVPRKGAIYDTSLVISPDSRLLAISSSDTLTLCDLVSGKPTAKVDCFPGRVAFSADGRSLVYVDTEGFAWVHDRKGKILRRFGKLANDKSSSTALSSDGRTLAIRSGTLVQSGNIFTGKLHPSFKRPYNFVHGPTISPDGRTMALGVELPPKKGEPDPPPGTDRPVLIIVETVTGRERARCSWPPGMFSSQTFSPDGQMLAWRWGKTVNLMEPTTGRKLASFSGHMSSVGPLAFSADGRLLVSASIDTTALVWDVARFQHSGPAICLSTREQQARWADLASRDAAKAYRAIGVLAASHSASFLRTQLHRVPPGIAAARKRFPALLIDLGSERLAVREKARLELEKLGDWIEPDLRRVLARPRSLEVHLRVKRLLAKLDGVAPSPEVLRVLRAVEVLERMGSAEARKVLRELAKGETDNPLVQEARAALDRLALRPVGSR
jgi:WD40 repeat protein